MWLKFVLFAALFLAIGELIQWLLSKFLKVQRKKLFSYNYVNDLHKKVDWILRLAVVIPLLIAIFTMASREYSPYVFVALLLFANIIPAIGTVFFEWKYAPTRKQSILTISEIAYIVIVISAVIQFDLLAFMIQQI